MRRRSLARSRRKSLRQIDSLRIAEHIRSQFQLDWEGIHGPAHWGRVRAIGLELARSNGADPLVVELFAWFHDARRFNDSRDPEHGIRGAALAAELCGELFTATDAQMALLKEACCEHSDGHLQADVTVQTCWDADRLDLARVGIIPDPSKLCTEAARSPLLLEKAMGRSERWSRWRWSRRYR
jgi:uncharacterized protein